MGQVYRCPIILKVAIDKAKSKEELKPLLQAYHAIYGMIPDCLCALYSVLPDK